MIGLDPFVMRMDGRLAAAVTRDRGKPVAVAGYRMTTIADYDPSRQRPAASRRVALAVWRIVDQSLGMTPVHPQELAHRRSTRPLRP